MAEKDATLLQSRAVSRWVRITPRKMRLVADLIRGKKVNDVINMLSFTTKRAAEPVEKAVKSALENLRQQEAAADVDSADVLVHEIRVDEGPTLKRMRPRAMGRAYRILKRTSHLTVVLSAKRTTTPAPKKRNKSKVVAVS